MTTVNYYYIGDSAPSVASKPAPKALADDGKLLNPLFNFNSSFTKGLESIPNTVVAQSQPYISLKSMKLDGEVLQDLNLSFFHKPLRMDEIRTGGRFSDRTNMSLQDIEISTDLASGYLYYTHVKFKIKIHKPDLLVNTSLMYFLFPAAPLLLEYGWNSPNEELLNQKETLLFSVKTYNITFDEVGQIDLTVEGTAFNDKFSSVLIGDLGNEIANKATAGTQFAGIFTTLKQIKAYESYFNDLKTKGDGAQENDYALKKALTEDYQSVEKVARGEISKNFKTAKKKLLELTKVEDFSSSSKRPPIGCVTFHDVVKTLCNDTLEKLSDTFPKVQELRVVYGKFNEKTPTLKASSIADFPINYEKLKNVFKNFHDAGKFAPTISDLLSTLISTFIENQEYWRSLLSEGEEFNAPDVVVNFYNNGKTVDMSIIDTKANIPPTIPRTPDGKGSSSSFKEAVLSGIDVPIISVGHAQSFLKSISFSQITDSYMKAALIERMVRDRIIGPRATKVPGDALGEVPITPLTLPLKGTATVLGHPAWKPFKVFFMETGIFVIDGLYKITKVVHRLKAGSYETQIDFMWH